MTKPFTLDAIYPLRPDGRADLALDDNIIRLVGAAPTGFSRDAETPGERDVSFSFGSRGDVDAAVARVRAELPDMRFKLFDWTVKDSSDGEPPVMTAL